MKYIVDITLSIIGLFIVMPIFIIVIFSIKLTSKGPIIYSQIRIGKDKKKFKIYKFRTMIKNANLVGSSITTSLDKRITPIGRILRKIKLDELPQLINVIKGEMSLVGPRPEVPEIVDKYTPEMCRIFNARPGITSITSLYLREEEKLLDLAMNPNSAYEEVIVPEKVRLAMLHVDKNSFWFDFGVLVRTVWAVSFGRFTKSSSENTFYASLREKLLKFNNASTDS
jgi:lipopolysaccharide/colanic/teichoic acid biosynthesis glycosyltransferase